MIEDGKTTSIGSCFWVPGELAHHKIGVTQSTTTFVSGLIFNGAWNIPLVQASFSPQTTKKILFMDLSQMEVPDSQFWRGTSNGVFSIKSV